MGGNSSDSGSSAPVPSVVVPNLDNAEFLALTLQCLEAQQVADLDVMIVDGGSTDGSVEIIEAWARDHGARWISERDEGQAQAINKGFRMARGDIVSWLNSDDTLPAGSVSRAVEEFARDPDLDFLWGFCLYVDQLGQPLRIGNPYVRWDLAELRGRRNFVAQPGSWFRRSLFDRFGYLDESYDFAFDYEIFLRIAGSAKARFIPEIMSHFRLHPTSKTVSRSHLSVPEQWRAHRAHGGRLLSPFALDVLRNQLVVATISRLMRPVRNVVWRAIGLKPGSRIRP
jgi:glycosyltransferase involved in cell wall biosynthesis